MRIRPRTFVGCAVSAALALGLSMIAGLFWSFLLLVGFWLSANMVAWFGRHPPPASAYRGGRRDDE